MKTAAIEVIDLKKRYAEVEAVRGIGFSVGSGEIFGFLGPNGAGKTTTIKILCTLLQATSGTARLAGLDVAASPEEVRRRIGVIFQDPALDDRLTADENLMLHAVAYRVPRADRRARIDEALQFVNLFERRKDLTRTFSGGMKRRLEIARGLVHRPDILFLDEPTTGLDPQTRARTWEVLRGLRAKYGTTLFLTTHYMDEAENCDRIAIVDHGLIVALDTPAALKQRVGKDQDRRADRRSGGAGAAALGEVRHRQHRGRRRPDVPGRGGGRLHRQAAHRPQSSPLEGISVRRPTLDDVFLSLTGRRIRAEGAEGNAAKLRALVRRRG